MAIAKNGWNLYLYHPRGRDVLWCETREGAKLTGAWYRANTDVTHTAIRKVSGQYRRGE
jgi:hypothetical protein